MWKSKVLTVPNGRKRKVFGTFARDKQQQTLEFGGFLFIYFIWFLCVEKPTQKGSLMAAREMIAVWIEVHPWGFFLFIFSNWTPSKAIFRPTLMEALIMDWANIKIYYKLTHLTTILQIEVCLIITPIFFFLFFIYVLFEPSVAESRFGIRARDKKLKIIILKVKMKISIFFLCNFF